MRQLSPWWVFFVAFICLIVGIHGLRLCVAPANAAPASVNTPGTDVVAAKRHINGESRHWRSMLLQP